MLNDYDPTLIEINSQDLSFVLTSWTNKTLKDKYGSSYLFFFSDIFYYPKINTIIMPRKNNNRVSNGVYLNIAKNPYSNYSWCGATGINGYYDILESPYECPISWYESKLSILILDDNQYIVSTITTAFK
jgi:hypothetical protein